MRQEKRESEARVRKHLVVGFGLHLSKKKIPIQHLLGRHEGGSAPKRASSSTKTTVSAEEEEAAQQQSRAEQSRGRGGRRDAEGQRELGRGGAGVRMIAR